MDAIKTARRPIDQPHGGDIAGLRAQLGLERDDLVDFSVSVNPFGPPPAVRDYCARPLPNLAAYPDPEASGLVEAAASRHGIDPGSIIVGAGAAELLYWLIAYLKPRRAVVPQPAFSDYARAAKANGAEVITVALEERHGFAIDWAALERASAGADLLVIGHPNNPTGRLADKSALMNFIDAHPELLVLVDEAFIDFAAHDGYSLTAPAVERDNVLVLRSLTKIYSIPNLRLGYLVGAPWRMRRMRPARPPWPLGEAQIESGRLALADIGFLSDTRTRIADARSALFQELETFAWLKPWASDTNFLLVKILEKRVNDQMLLEQLARAGIVIRSCGSFPGLGDRFFRTAVRDLGDNRLLVESLRRLEATLPLNI